MRLENAPSNTFEGIVLTQPCVGGSLGINRGFSSLAYMMGWQWLKPKVESRTIWHTPTKWNRFGGILTKIKGVNTDCAREDLCPLSAVQWWACELPSKSCPGCMSRREMFSLTKNYILTSDRKLSGVQVFKWWPQRMALGHQKVQKEIPLPVWLQKVGLSPFSWARARMKHYSRLWSGRKLSPKAAVTPKVTFEWWDFSAHLVVSFWWM